MTNLIEQLAYSLGRIRGTYLRALKGANAPLGDPTAWNVGRYWGEGSVALSEKPGNRADIAKWFTSWAYICATTNANVRAAVPTGLFVASATKGMHYETVTTRKLSRPHLKYIENRQDLRPYLLKSEDVEEVTSHRYLKLMERPNPFMSESDLKYLTSIFMDLAGAAYWYIGVKDKLGIPAQIWPIPAQYITPIPGKTLKEFVKGYRYERGRVKQDLPIEDVVEFKVPSPTNEYLGMACLVGMADAVYIGAKIDEYVEAMFENKARPGGVFTAEYGLSQPEFERASEELAQKYAGARKAGKNMIVPPGLKFDRDYVTPDEMAYIEGGKVTAQRICAGFGTPIALFDPTANRANVEGAQYTHAKYAVEPWLRRYDATINGDFIPIYDDSGILFVASDNPIPDDKDYLLRKRQVDLQTGVSLINEERANDGKEPVEGGDEPLVPFSLTPLSQVIAEPWPARFDAGGDDDDESEPSRKPKPGEEEEEDETEGDDLDTGDAGKLAELVAAKIREKLRGEG